MPANDQLAIDLHRVEKTYRGKVRALRGIDMQVHRGEIFGLLGPNGAGKSTLVKIMMTVVRPTRAEGTVLGRPVGRKSTLGRVGYLPEHHRFPRYLTGRQVLEFYAALANVPRARRRARADELIAKVEMKDWANVKISSYSKGMMQRIGLAQALVNDPDLVVLDEPTDGVDPVGRRDIRKLLEELRDEGRTIFLNSHLLGEVEAVCDRVAILVQGAVAQQGTIDGLTAHSQRYEIVIEGPPPAFADSASAPQALPHEDRRTLLIYRTTDSAQMQPAVDALRAAGKTIVSMRPVRETLEDLFMRAVTDPTTGKTLQPGAARNGGAA